MPRDESEASCTTFHTKMSFICMGIKRLCTKPLCYYDWIDQHLKVTPSWDCCQICRFRVGEEFEKVNGVRCSHYCLQLYVSRESLSVAGETTDVAGDCANCWLFDTLIYKTVIYFALVYRNWRALGKNVLTDILRFFSFVLKSGWLFAPNIIEKISAL